MIADFKRLQAAWCRDPASLGNPPCEAFGPAFSARNEEPPCDHAAENVSPGRAWPSWRRIAAGSRVGVAAPQKPLRDGCLRSLYSRKIFRFPYSSFWWAGFPVAARRIDVFPEPGNERGVPHRAHFVFIHVRVAKAAVDVAPSVHEDIVVSGRTKASRTAVNSPSAWLRENAAPCRGARCPQRPVRPLRRLRRRPEATGTGRF